MPRYKKGKSNFQSFQSMKGGRLVAVYFDMMDSKAWGELTGNDIKVYMYMLRKYTAKYERGILINSNKDNISCPRAEYEKVLTMTHNTFDKCVDNLIELGFIMVKGYKALKGFAEVTIYGFNDMWQKYGTEGFSIKESWKRMKRRAFNQKEKNEG